MNTSIIKTMLIASALTLVAMPAIAAQGQGFNADPVQFSELDLDNNGLVSSEEHAQFQAQRISERQAAGYPMRNIENAGERYQQLDLNNDQQLSEEEFSSYQTAMMNNRSGKSGKAMGRGQSQRGQNRVW